jgi:hypothetical protein
MILFFDRDVGTSLPKALLALHFDKQYHETHYHQQHFAIDEKDDIWMPEVGKRGWTIIGHDSKHHIEEAEISAIKQYNIGCFYLWGCEAKRWEKMRCFAKAYWQIVKAEAITPKPFIFKIGKSGSLEQIPIPK